MSVWRDSVLLTGTAEKVKVHSTNAGLVSVFFAIASDVGLLVFARKIDVTCSCVLVSRFAVKSGIFTLR